MKRHAIRLGVIAALLPVVVVAPLPFASSGRAAATGPSDEVVVLHNARGMVVRLTPHGATVMAIEVPDRAGRKANVVLGYATPAEYREKNHKDAFGATVGRYAGRIGQARFVLDGQTVRLEPNEGPNALHGGGKTGFATAEWRIARRPSATRQEAAFSLISPDGDQRFPGRLAVTVTYRLAADNSLRIDYRATTTRPTVLNLTNHSYFNLAGEGSGTVAGHLLQVVASRYVETDAAGIPTGALPALADTPLDFRQPRAIGERINSSAKPMTGHGFNHGWLFDKPAGVLAPVVQLSDPASGRTLSVETTEPSVQLYTGDYIDGRDRGPSGLIIHARDGIAIETEHPSDSPNHPDFPTTILRPGEVFRSTTIWRFGTTATP